MATAKHRGDRRAAPARRRSSASAELIGRELEIAPAARPARPRRAGRRRCRRRPAAPDVHRLPPGAVRRGAGRADAAAARRPDDAGDRARVPRPEGDGRAAHRAREADARRGARAVRGARRATSSAERLSSVLEVIYLVFNEGYAATAGEDWMRPGAVRGRAAARPHPGRADARTSRRSTGWSR